GQAGQHSSTSTAARPAVPAPKQVDDVTLQVRALVVHAATLSSEGGNAAALIPYTQALTMARDEMTSARFDKEEMLGGWAALPFWTNWALHSGTEKLDTAIAAAQEALPVYQPNAPRYTLIAYR